jgi:hypothetical protein
MIIIKHSERENHTYSINKIHNSSNELSWYYHSKISEPDAIFYSWLSNFSHGKVLMNVKTQIPLTSKQALTKSSKVSGNIPKEELYHNDKPTRKDLR